jgi:nicotinamidase-related amidase
VEEVGVSSIDAHLISTILARLNDYVGFTELPKLLFSQQPPIRTVVVVGLASDYCVLSSAVDAIKFKLRTILVKDGVKGVDQDKTNRAYQEMESWGVEIIQSDSDLSSTIK